MHAIDVRKEILRVGRMLRPGDYACLAGYSVYGNLFFVVEASACDVLCVRRYADWSGIKVSMNRGTLRRVTPSEIAQHYPDLAVKLQRFREQTGQR